jgi:two-component system, NarL family, response regulator NreC
MRAIERQGFHIPGTAPEVLKLILVDDHAILRDGLRALMGGVLDLEVVGEAESVEAGISLARQLLPDVVIIDVSFPVGSGIQAIGALRRECAHATIIALTVHDDVEYRRAAMQAGADEFVAKHAPFEVLLRAIRSAASHGDHRVRTLPAAPLRGALEMRTWSSSVTMLTARERQVLVGIARGFTSRRIAEKMGRSVKTIVKHRSNMMRKLSLHEASSVTRFAISSGLLAADAAGDEE